MMAETHNPFSFKARIKSFHYALRGLFILITTQHNAWIHALATVLVCVSGFLLGFSRSEWCWIIGAMLLVWVAEAFNTACEFLADALSPDYNALVGKAKDVAAGAVLIAAIGSVVIGILIIGPHILAFLSYFTTEE